MKKILLSFFVICFSIVASSQVIIPKGKKIIGGSFALSNQKLETDGMTPPPTGLSNTKQFGLVLSPSVGWTIDNNAVFGILLYTQIGNWEYRSSSSNVIEEGSSFAAGPGVFYEKFWGLGKNFHFSGMGSLRTTFGEQEQKTFNNTFVYSESESKVKAVNLAITPFIGYSINNKWMVQASIGEIFNMGYSDNETITKSSSSAEQKSEYNTFQINSRLNRGLELGNLTFALRYSF